MRISCLLSNPCENIGAIIWGRLTVEFRIDTGEVLYVWYHGERIYP